ncbi:MAG: low molecular weight phosphotyrosine protein phosphatase [Phycisphaerales bacterium]|nr:low molecular weight phosphotyrosine protein phosphatase [Phycisphaerales bacterium]
MTSVLFVCLGNICRSPLAEGVFRDLAQKRRLSDKLEIESAGTGAWHVGNPPDPRSIEIANEHGIDISQQQARRITEADFSQFDFIFAMDQDNLRHLSAHRPPDGTATLSLFLDYAGLGQKDVPDPYYGGTDGFQRVYGMIETASSGILDRLFPVNDPS